MDTNSTLSKIEAEISQDPSNSIWIKYLLYPFAVFGLFSIMVSGFIAYKFLTGIFSNFWFWALILVISFEGTKIGVIIIYEYSKKRKDYNFSPTLKRVLWSTRIILIFFSILCSFSKISEYLNNPNYAELLKERKTEISTEYGKIIQKEDSLLLKELTALKSNMDSISFNYPNKKYLYREQKKIWESGSQHREERMKQLRFERDSLITKAQKSLIDDSRSKNKILVGVYSTITKAGYEFDFNKFYALLVILISFTITLILELIIWAVFGIIGSIYEGVFSSKIKSFVEMQQTLENTKINNFNDDAKSINIINKVKNSVNENISKAKSYVDAIENDN